MEDVILRAARKVFLRDGYQASTTAVIREAGIARQTLYNHFKSKADLFKAVVDHATWQTMRSFRTLDIGPDIELPEALLTYAENYMEGMLKPESLALMRLISSAASEHPEAVKAGYAAISSTAVLSTYLRAQVEAGKIHCPAPDLIAESFFGALAGPARFRYMLLGAENLATAAEQNTYRRQVVDLYVEALRYGRMDQA